MKYLRFFSIAAFSAVVLLAQINAAGQAASEGKVANVVGGAGTVRWELMVANSGGTLTIAFPDGRSIRRAFRPGVTPEINLSDKQLENLPDGVYTYELQMAPAVSTTAKDAKARPKDDEPENERAMRKRPAVQGLSQSGSFAIQGGMIIVAGAVEGQRGAAKTTVKPRATGVISGNTAMRLRHHMFTLGALPDDVIPDDLIVQGSACVGLDCVNGESFGFDTIRLKENNTRLQFDDTSTSAGFPTNNWQIRANSSSSGGASFLAFVDQGSTGNSETGTIVFEVDAGAPANSLKVSSAGKVGIRTGTPVLDVHMNSTDTPAIRMEQNNTGGFTAQTWDIGANEANFFVRDVTGGSRLPFRIRPGAPTSSIDISASGKVGINTASPESALTVVSTTVDATGDTFLRVKNTTSFAGVLLDPNQAGDADWLLLGGFPAAGDFTVREFGVANYLTIKKTTGRVGIGTSAPDQLLSVNGDASKVGGGSWQTFSDERLKNILGKYSRGLSAVMRLQPLFYEYKSDNALGLKSEGQHVGFGAQSLQQVIPEAVTKTSDGYLMVNNDPILWTMLNAIKEQQKEIEDLKAQVTKLKASSRRHRR